MSELLRRLPVPVAPARHETLASYLSRLAALHGLKPRELWDAVTTTVSTGAQRDVDAGRLAAVTGRPATQLAFALPELRAPAPDWIAWRHQPQPRCPRCDARHDGGPVQRLLPQHRYVCTRHGYWIGPPDTGQQAAALSESAGQDIVTAQHRHSRLVRRHGATAAFDAVLTGFLFCGHIWEAVHDAGWRHLVERWDDRIAMLMPNGLLREFTASKVFAAVYPEAVDIAELIAAPAWRAAAAGSVEQQHQFLAAITRRLVHDGPYIPPDGGDAITHWAKYDSWQPPSRPHTLFPQTRAHRSTKLTPRVSASIDRQERSAVWFLVKRNGGSTLLHHRHLAPVLVRDWSPAMDGIKATIYASRSTFHPVDERAHADSA